MKKTFKFVVVLVLLALLLSACGPKEAANKLEAIKAEGKIVAGTSADYPPFESVDENGELVGFDIDLMNKIGEEMGVEVEIVDMPFDSLLAAVQEGKIDISIAAFNYSEERDKNVDFSDAYFSQEDGFLVAEDFAGEITKPEDAANYVLAVQTGATADEWATANLLDTGLISEENYFRYERVDQAALDVKAGRVDVLMADYYPILALAEEMDGLKMAYHAVVSAGPIMIILPDGETELTDALNEAIGTLQDSGFVDEVAKKHLGGS